MRNQRTHIRQLRDLSCRELEATRGGCDPSPIRLPTPTQPTQSPTSPTSPTQSGSSNAGADSGLKHN